MAVDVKSACVDDPLPLQFARLKGQSVVALPKNGALPGVVDQDDRLLAGASRYRDEVGLNAQAIKLSAVNRGSTVITDLADIASAQTPLLACGNGSCHLPARQDVGGAKFDFGSECRIVRKTNQHVGSIQSDTDQVNLGQWIHDGFS